MLWLSDQEYEMNWLNIVSGGWIILVLKSDRQFNWIRWTRKKMRTIWNSFEVIKICFILFLFILNNFFFIKIADFEEDSSCWCPIVVFWDFLVYLIFIYCSKIIISKPLNVHINKLTLDTTSFINNPDL